MALEFATITPAGGYFKAADHADAVAILVEPTRFERQRPGSTFGPKDAIHADLSIFRTQAELDAGTPEEITGAIIQGTALVRDLETLVGKAAILSLNLKPNSKPGHKDFWVWRNVDGGTQAKVVEFAQKREAALETAKSSGAMPSFLS